MTPDGGLLLDTHVLLWWPEDSPELPDEVKERIDTDLVVCVSAATVWELAVKQAIGKLELPADYLTAVSASDMTRTPILFEHAVEAESLPFHHRDPFDRMLVAQARAEGLTLVTRDEHVQRYDVPVLQA